MAPTKRKQLSVEESPYDRIFHKLNQIQESSKEAFKYNSLEMSQLREEVKILKESAANQSEVIVNLLSELKVIVKSNLCPGLQKLKYKDLFPISTQAELEAVEEEINDDTKEAMIATIKFKLGNGKLQKSLKDLIDIPLLMEYNVYGLQRKKRLLNYPKFMKTIYRSMDSKFGNKTDFFKYFGQCIRLVKNLYYKNESIKRSNSAIHTDSESSQD